MYPTLKDEAERIAAENGTFIQPERRDEAMRLITAYRKLTDAQKFGFRLMLEGASMLSEKEKRPERVVNPPA